MIGQSAFDTGIIQVCHSTPPNQYFTCRNYFAEHVDRIDNRTVPATIAELILTFVDGQQRTLADGAYVIDVAAADAALPRRQTREAVAGGGGYGRQRRDFVRTQLLRKLQRRLLFLLLGNGTVKTAGVPSVRCRQRRQ